VVVEDDVFDYKPEEVVEEGNLTVDCAQQEAHIMERFMRK